MEQSSLHAVLPETVEQSARWRVAVGLRDCHRPFGCHSWPTVGHRSNCWHGVRYSISVAPSPLQLSQTHGSHGNIRGCSWLVLLVNWNLLRSPGKERWCLQRCWCPVAWQVGGWDCGYPGSSFCWWHGQQVRLLTVNSLNPGKCNCNFKLCTFEIRLGGNIPWAL